MKGRKMKRVIAFTVAAAAFCGFAADKVAIKFDIPPPHSSGTPKEVKSDNLEPDPGPGKYRAPIMVPAGFDKKLTTEDTVVTTSEEAVTGDNEFVVDADKTPDATCMLQLPGGVQWVQLDLGAEKTISAVCVWHDQGDDRVYKDVIIQLSNDAKFATGVTTIFNNDHDNSSKLGKGSDKEYRERNDGRPIDGKLTKARYVRCYSAGSTSEPVNNYVEIEVFGK
jgi:hypothetical protein